MSNVPPDPQRPRGQHAAADRDLVLDANAGSETKAAYKTTEFAVYVLMVLGLIVAAAVADEASDFGAQEMCKYLTWLTIGYMVARGLAKSGVRAATDDDSR